MAIRCVVRGRVQGVGFRWFIQRQLRALDCAGWVRNLPDGSVEVVVEGSPESLQRAREIIRTGPIASRVDRVEDEGPVPADPLPRPFRIE